VDDFSVNTRTPPRWAGVVTVMLALSLAALGVFRWHARSGTAADQHVLEWMIAHHRAGFTVVAVAVTRAGSPTVVAVIALLLAGLLWWSTRSLARAVLLAGPVLAAGAASTTLKVLVAAQRPPHAAHLVTETGHAFPSGHVVGTLTLLGMAAIMVGTQTQRRVLRIVMALAVAAIVSVIAVTRLYLGVHWLTDVIGGFLLGSLTIMIGYGALARMPPIAHRPTVSRRLPRRAARPADRSTAILAR
jgi:membrane-associated phospholipid phosphatase